VEDIHKRFGHLQVLKGVSLSANEGDVIALIGSSGSGKAPCFAALIFWKRRIQAMCILPAS
jgi:ABC-type histidine transport system ATPase subunit